MQPGPYSNYPRAPIQEINFGVIGEGWNLITKNWMPFAIATLMALLAAGIVQVIGYIVVLPMSIASASTENEAASAMTTVVTQLIGIPFSILSIAIAAPFNMSITHMALKLVSGQAIDTNDAFVGLQRLGPSMIAGVLIGLGTTIGSYCCCIPGLLFGGLTLFTFPLILTRNLAPIDAIRESWGMLQKHMWMAMLLYLTLVIVSGLGIIACLIGVLITAPLLYVGPALVFRDFQVQPVGPVPSGPMQDVPADA